jgi:shikimate dehydrogenase
MGLDYVYVPFTVKTGQLSRAIEGVRALGIRGINVTIPHKVAVIPLLDRVDALAMKIGKIDETVFRSLIQGKFGRRDASVIVPP